jgi:hypothetical protein
MKMEVVKVIFVDGQTMYAEPEYVDWFYEVFGVEYFNGKVKEVTKPFKIDII